MAEGLEHEITLLLRRWSGGEQGALDRLISLVYPELRAIAARYMARERTGHTLQCTALVHEAYLRLAAHPEKEWKDRRHFFAIAARIVRGILVDHARARRTMKRRADRMQVTVWEQAGSRSPAAVDLLDLDQALDELEQLDAQQSRLVELRFFGGLSMEETAETLGLSLSTAKREWTIAKTFIRRHVRGAAKP